MSAAPRVAGLVLAAGAASRFGSPKALALLDGQPILRHVLDAADSAGLAEIVVVLGVAADEIDRSIEWGTARRVRNPAPERGLSSSLQAGLAALGQQVEAAIVLLGDQPRVRPDVIRRLIATPIGPSRPIVVPRYSGGGGPNPAVLHRSAWSLAQELTGDRGMGPVIAAHPDLVEEIPVEGQNPDVDTTADLAALASGVTGSASGRRLQARRA